MKNHIIKVVLTILIAVPAYFAQQPSPTPMPPDSGQPTEEKQSQSSNTLNEYIQPSQLRTSRSIIQVWNKNYSLTLGLTARTVKGSNLPKFQIVLLQREKYFNMTKEYLIQQTMLSQQNNVNFMTDTLTNNISLILDDSSITETSFNYIPTLIHDRHFKADLTNKDVSALLTSNSINFTSNKGQFSSAIDSIGIMKTFIKEEKQEH